MKLRIFREEDVEVSKESLKALLMETASSGFELGLFDECKFIAFRSRKGVEACLFPADHAHFSVARYDLEVNDDDFVGAGKVSFSTEGTQFANPAVVRAWFDSETCRPAEAYGRDRPQIPAEAEVLIDELRGLVARALGAV